MIWYCILMLLVVAGALASALLWPQRNSESRDSEEDGDSAFALNRYDPDALIAQVMQKRPLLVAKRWEFVIETPLIEVGIDLPDSDDSFSNEAMRFLLEILRNVRELDNLVQVSVEKESRGKPHRGNYELGLGWISISAEDVSSGIAVLTYYGMRWNTSWDAKFQRDRDGKWRSLNF